ncbi:hypothetical protein AAHC03_016774 [Spirometra sp. Aus1]
MMRGEALLSDRSLGVFCRKFGNPSFGLDSAAEVSEPTPAAVASSTISQSTYFLNISLLVNFHGAVVWARNRVLLHAIPVSNPGLPLAIQRLENQSTLAFLRLLRFDLSVPVEAY